MKKLNYLLLGLAGLGMVSCSQSELVNENVGDGNFNITVKLPDNAVATRTLGDGYASNVLYMALYDADNDNSLVLQDLELNFGGELQTTVSLNLVSGKTYNIVFFAQSEAAQQTEVYDFDVDNGTLTVNYEEMTSENNIADAYDCFFRCYNTGTVSSTMQNTTIELYRPVAQINWGTNDLNETTVSTNFGDLGENISTSLNTTAYNQLNFFTSDVVETSKVPVKLEDFANPYSETFPVAGYDYVAIQYLLAPKATTAVYDLTLTVSNANDQSGAAVIENDIVVANAPVQANYRTNIYGNLLSDNISFEVVKEAEWNTPANDIVIINGVQYTSISSQTVDMLYRAKGNYILSEDVNYDGGALQFIYDLILDLNGHTLTTSGSNSGDAVVVQGTSSNGTNITLSNGTIESSPIASRAYLSASLLVQGTNYPVNLTLDNMTIADAVVYPILMTSQNPQSTITINSGTYYSSEDDGPAVRVGSNQTATESGKVTIYGGTFGKSGVTNAYLLNILDNISKGKDPRQYIEVYGGTFINFNPQNNGAEGTPTNFVAEGYQVVEKLEGTDTYYTVIPGDYTPVKDQEDLNSAVKTPNATVYMQAGEYTFPSGVANGVTFTGTPDAVFNVGDSQTANYTNVTFDGITFVGTENYRGLQHSSNLTYKNCVLNGLFFCYADGLIYENCTFNQTGDAYSVWTYGANNIQFNNCVFNGEGKSVLLYSQSTGKINVSFSGCTFTSKENIGEKSAIMINGGDSPTQNQFIVKINNCSATGYTENTISGTELWGVKTADVTTQVYVNGKEVYNTLAE